MKTKIGGIITLSSLYYTSATICLFAITTLSIQAQNVGINTTNPTRELSVNGSVIVDHDSSNYGTLFDPSLLFGANGLTGINSNQNPINSDYRALNFWTGGQKRMMINHSGQVGIGTQSPSYTLDVTGSLRATGTIIANTNIVSSNNITATAYLYGNSAVRAGGGSFNNAYKLQVNNGNSLFNGNGTFTGILTSNGNLVTDANLIASGLGQFGGSLSVTGPLYANGNLRVYDHMAIGGNVDNNYRFRIYDGNARIGGEFHATGNSAIGGSVDQNFRFRVYDGNSRFGGDAQVTGTLNTEDLVVGNNFTINGTGSVRSNGASPLKISFHQFYLNVHTYGGNTNTIDVPLPEFTGGSDDVRIHICQFEPAEDPGDFYNSMLFMPTFVDDDDDSFKLKIKNTGPSSWITGTLYYMVVLKD